MHGVIEFGNRMLTSLVGFAAAAAFVGAFRRRPYRRDLMLLGALLPFGVVAQIVSAASRSSSTSRRAS